MSVGPSQYKIFVYNFAGTKTAEISDYEELAYTKQRNYPGAALFTVRTNHPAIVGLEDDCIIEIRRKNDSLDLAWYTDFTGVYVEERRFWDGFDRVTIVLAGLNELLWRRIVAWYTGTSNRSEFSAVAAETIAKTLVSYNAGANATVANGRIRTAETLGITIEGDGSQGNVLSYRCAYDILLEALQGLAGVNGNGDFNLERIGTSGRSFIFRWYPGQLGTDRTATVLFSLKRGNMTAPLYVRSWRARKTSAVVCGQGEGTARDTAIRLSSTWNGSNDAELFVDARDLSVGSTAQLNTRGDKALAENIETERFTFGVLQNENCFYGVHYFLGDRVSWEYQNKTGTVLIDSVTVSAKAKQLDEIEIGTKLEY